MNRKKRKECCYAGIFNKIDHIENKINEIKTQLTNLKDNFIDHNGDEAYLNEPVAPREMPDG